MGAETVVSPPPGQGPAWRTAVLMGEIILVLRGWSDKILRGFGEQKMVGRSQHPLFEVEVSLSFYPPLSPLSLSLLFFCFCFCSTMPPPFPVSLAQYRPVRCIFPAVLGFSSHQHFLRAYLPSAPATVPGKPMRWEEAGRGKDRRRRKVEGKVTRCKKGMLRFLVNVSGCEGMIRAVR